MPWTVVSHAADDSIPATALPTLMAWLDDQPDVSLHSVLWAAGPNGPRPFDFGRLANVGAAHEGVLASGLRKVGLRRLGGGVAGRQVRWTLRKVPAHGVLYLSTAWAGAILRYLDLEPFTVVTHLHAADRLAEPPLDEDRVGRLVAATDVWLADDDETRTWAATTWGLDAGRIHVVPPTVDASSPEFAAEARDPDLLRLGLHGSTWFRRDHAPRLIQTILRVRPDIQLDLLWTEATPVRDVGTLLHDLEHLGVRDRLVIPDAPHEVRGLISRLDVLALTTPDGDSSASLVQSAAEMGIQIVCFDTHPASASSAPGDRWVVAYLDIEAMAEAVLDILDAKRMSWNERVEAARADMQRRYVSALGPRIRELVDGAAAR